MARDDGSGSATVQKKLFGPFNGLNGTQSPFLRELPPSANAAPREFATEFQNLIIDDKTAELVSRYGMEYADKGSADPDLSEIQAAAGLFKWIDYDALTGKARERALILSVDQDGVPSIHDYRLIKTQVKVTDASLDGKLFAIIEDPDSSDAKRFIFYNNDGSVHTSATTLAGVANISISYVDYDADRDGSFVTGAVDLLKPTLVEYNASNGTPLTIAEFWSLCKKTTTNSNIDLSSWINSLDDEDAVFFTGDQASNVMYFSGGGVCPMLKYDGQDLFKAGAPNAFLHGRRFISLQETLASSFEADYGENPLDVVDGLMNSNNDADIGNFVYMPTYEIRDAKNNAIEGSPYLNVGKQATFFADEFEMSHFELEDVNLTGGTPVVPQPSQRSLLASDGFNARGALLKSDVMTYSRTLTTVTVTQTAHGWVTGQKIYFIATSGTALSGYYTITGTPTADTFTFTTVASGSTSGNCNVRRALVTADVASDFVIPVDSTKNTLKALDKVCIKGLLLSSSTSYDSTYRLPIVVTAKLAGVTSSELTIDTDYPISIEVCPGGDFLSNGADGFLSSTLDSAKQSIVNGLLALTSWNALLEWDWNSQAVSSSKFVLTSEYCISNDVRINFWRNKAAADEGNSYDPTGVETSLIPDFYLVNIIPNNPFTTDTLWGPTYDNCTDGSLGALYVPKSTLSANDAGYDGDNLASVDYSPLPKGRALDSFKGRLHVSGDPENVNILWRSHLTYGTEYFSPDDTLSMETDVGDDIVTTLGNDEAQFILKGNSLKVILNGFTSDEIRIDDMVVGDYGCIAPRSACQLGGGIAYLSADGVVYAQTDKEIRYLGQNENGVSRIKDLLLSPENDLKRATAVVDTVKGHYRLYIPKITKSSAGLYNPTDTRHSDNPYYNELGFTLVYDYNNDAWFKQTGINAKGGMIVFSESTDRLFTLSSYARNSSDIASSLEWSLYKERNYDNLWAYADRLERDGVEELQEIEHVYATDWLAFDDPNELKKFLRCKMYGLRVFDDLTVLGTSGTERAALGQYTFDVQAYRDWREDDTHTDSTLTLTGRNLHDYMKCRTNKAGVMKFVFFHTVLYSSPRIMAIEVEAAKPFKPRMKPWGIN